ncbi:MAG TPA: tetratricopeptide repeat protein [Candidatus Sulfotelmatobacter sp.]|nr:tetratricopeptide repeat protein [Candidatus Sulfotelmatobacter sp.]
MALFGFNKQKVLSSAEKYVQQGKIQNAIAEYEKVLKNDSKDLTVTNTVGDLYTRLGETDKATTCFKTVGDAYASQGFTVKAIAMYKKICKLQPSLESLLKLAELYSQQGLFNDARAQYLQVAEEFLKANELENAVRIFQKILEMDPENSNMRVRLAEVYVRLNKKTDAWQIFSAAAESLRSKGSLSEAEAILQRMLKLDPNNTYALLMQGKNLIESGDAAGAVTALQRIGDIDSHPDGLRDLLKAYLQTGQLSEAGGIASKLLTVHNDLAAISSFADALMQAGQYENALQVFDQHAERLLAENSDKVLDCLHAIIGHVRDNPDSLKKLLDLFHKAGDTSHVSEVTELLAHASVQSGDLSEARDLYQKLANLEPANPLHVQNYQQVVGQISGTSGNKLISPEEAAVILEDLESTAPSIHQHYSDEVSLAVRSALTDAELFISYNMPAKALGPLLAALPMAPSDLRLNQRLATLHTRANRFAEAALCCRTLQHIYSEADHPDEATRYGELAERYEERTSIQIPDAAAEDAAVPPLSALTAQAPNAARPLHHDSEVEVPEFSIEEASPEVSAVQEEAPEVAMVAPTASPWPTIAKHEPKAAPAEFAVADESSAATATPSEIDLSSEWDDAITVEADAPAEEPAEAQVATASSHGIGESSKATETVDEIRFYISHGMPAQAMAALAKLQTLTNDQAQLDAIRAEIEAAIQPSEEEVTTEPVMEELTADDIPTFDVEVDAASVDNAPAAEVAAPLVELPVVEVPVVEGPPVVARPQVVEPEPVVPQAPTRTQPAAAVEQPAPQPAVLQEFVSDLETSLGDGFLPDAVARKSAPVGPPAAPVSRPAAPVEPAVAAEASAPVLGVFVADIEASLGDDFLKGAPVAAPQAVAPVASAAKATPKTASPAPMPVVAPRVAAPLPVAPVVEVARVAPPMAASAAASAAPHAAPPPQQSSPVMSGPAAPATASVAWQAPPMATPKPQAPASSISHAGAPRPSAKASPFGDDAGVDLAEMFGELKQDLEADVASADEDPETHYNLGIAFREMGLLDEAIGELQKACQAFDRGKPFPQIMQTYTWLAQCFLEKSVPEAAVRWYDKALNVSGIDSETRVALHYELASAYETAGDKPAALRHFMDVYGSNIDYRDVAERIKALKS